MVRGHVIEFMNERAFDRTKLLFPAVMPDSQDCFFHFGKLANHTAQICGCRFWHARDEDVFSTAWNNVAAARSQQS